MKPISSNAPPRPTDIVDYLLRHVEGLGRRELEARLKSMRPGFWPSAKRVGDREAEPVTEKHLASLVCGLLATSDAIYAGEATQSVINLASSVKATTTATQMVRLPNNEWPTTFREFLMGAIRQWRMGIRPWKEHVDIHEIVVRNSPYLEAVVFFRDLDSTGKDGDIGYYLSFGSNDPRPYSPNIRLGELRSIDGDILWILANFLGAVEAPAAMAMAGAGE